MPAFPSYLRLLPLCLLTAGLLAGCSPTAFLAPPEPVAVSVPNIEAPNDIPPLDETAVATGDLLTPDLHVLARLRAAHQSWDGTPYRFGGASREGADCSGFVQRVFAENLRLALSRSTDTQVNEGREVAREDLRPGDLVFFRTGRRTRHVGIYMSGGRFLHSSTQRGVTIDRLSADYYERTYWTARRVMSDDHLMALAAEGQRPATAQAEAQTPRSTQTGRPAARPAAAPATERGSATSASVGRRAGW